MNSENGQLSVNLDHRITLLIRETECMAKMKLPVPTVTMAIFTKREYFMHINDSLKVKFSKIFPFTINSLLIQIFAVLIG